MNANKSATATFNLAPVGTYNLLVTVTGTGAGTVTSNPTGISCNPTCSASFNDGTSVTLTATPASGSIFAGWSGDCASAGTSTTCTLTMNANKSATATFTAMRTLS